MRTISSGPQVRCRCPGLTDGNTEAQNSKGFAPSGSVMLFIGTTFIEYLLCARQHARGWEDSSEQNMRNPGPYKALPASGEMRLWVNIPESIANYNHGRCFKIQM